MGISKAHAEWTGGFKDGQGVMKPAHAAEVHFSVGSRFEGAPASNPEEMIGAALAGCFSMALTLALEKEGLAPQRVRTDAQVKLEKDGGGFTVTGIELATTVAAAGLDAAKLDAIAQATKAQCPVGKALASVKIGLTTQLA